MEGIISTRSAIQEPLKTVTVRKNFANLLEKTASRFDHRQLEFSLTLRISRNTRILLLHYREEGKDELEKKTLVVNQEKKYNEICEHEKATRSSKLLNLF